mmetsp:Transcript_173397/g.556200  ORF Transcript_173397/g.556200 Transcript_173397/m.556200 type:complete len:324 (-) Transcript_173397:145-1116(-)
MNSRTRVTYSCRLQVEPRIIGTPKCESRRLARARSHPMLGMQRRADIAFERFELREVGPGIPKLVEEQQGQLVEAAGCRARPHEARDDVEEAAAVARGRRVAEPVRDLVGGARADIGVFVGQESLRSLAARGPLAGIQRSQPIPQRPQTKDRRRLGLSLAAKRARVHSLHHSLQVDCRKWHAIEELSATKHALGLAQPHFRSQGLTNMLLFHPWACPTKDSSSLIQDREGSSSPVRLDGLGQKHVQPCGLREVMPPERSPKASLSAVATLQLQSNCRELVRDAASTRQQLGSCLPNQRPSGCDRSSHHVVEPEQLQGQISQKR